MCVCVRERAGVYACVCVRVCLSCREMSPAEGFSLRHFPLRLLRICKRNFDLRFITYKRKLFF